MLPHWQLPVHLYPPQELIGRRGSSHMAAVRLPLSQSFAAFEERTDFQRKSLSLFESIQTYWRPSAPMARDGRLG